MADLAAAGPCDGGTGEDSAAVLLEAAGALEDAVCRVGDEDAHGGDEGGVGFAGGLLGLLALGRDAADDGARAGAWREGGRR